MANTKFLDQWVNGLEEYKKSLAPFTMEFAARTAASSEDTLKKVAHMIAEAGGVWRLWRWESPATAWVLMPPRPFRTCAHHWHYMKTGSGAYPLRGHKTSRAPAIMEHA